jgi:DNA-binding response OmpR family regulator
MSRGSSVARFNFRWTEMSKSNAGRAFPLHVVAQPSDEDVYDDGYLRVEHENYYLSCGGQPVYLPRVEFLLMSRLTRSIDRVVRSEELWRAAWGNRKPLNSASLQVYIHRLRAKLLPYRLHIDTVINVGYRLLKSDEGA